MEIFPLKRLELQFTKYMKILRSVSYSPFSCDNSLSTPAHTGSDGDLELTTIAASSSEERALLLEMCSRPRLEAY
jgi:hypothetical protein